MLKVVRAFAAGEALSRLCLHVHSSRYQFIARDPVHTYLGCFDVLESEVELAASEECFRRCWLCQQNLSHAGTTERCMKCV